MSSSSVVRADDSYVDLTTVPEFDSPKTQKSPLEPSGSPFEPDLFTWDPRKQCHVTPDRRSFFGMGLARRCTRCERLRARECNMEFRDWEMEQYEKWLEGKK